LIFHCQWFILSGIEAKISKALILGKFFAFCFKSHWSLEWTVLVHKIAPKMYDIHLVKISFPLPSLTVPIYDKGL
jgi:hypothetical protein